MKALVISGGGSKGAYAGGLAEYLMTGCGKEYELFIGTSTGGLLAPMLASGKLDEAKKVFTSVNQDSIFKVSPFNIKKLGSDKYDISMNLAGITKLMLKKHKSFGDSSNLRKLIKQCFLQEDFDRIRESGKQAIVTVSNLTNEMVEYKSTNDCEYEDFCDWMWASANAVPFMSLMVKNGIEYGDGGFGASIPIQKAIDEAANWVDVIALRPFEKSKTTPHCSNVFQVLVKTFNFLLNQGSLDDITIGRLAAEGRDVDINFYYTPRILSDQIFMFDPEQMTDWWAEGYHIGESTTPRFHCVKCPNSMP